MVAEGYISEQRNHIKKEENSVFPTADEKLTQGDQDEIIREFKKLERSDVGVGMHQKYIALADDLCRRWRVEKAPQKLACC